MTSVQGFTTENVILRQSDLETVTGGEVFFAESLELPINLILYL